MIINSLTEIRSQALFYSLKKFINANVYVKLEGLNVAGSIKLKPALWMLETLEREGKLIPNQSIVLCSSSGNLGIALGIVCKQKAYPLVCISDLNISPISEKYIELYGAKVIKVTERDKNGGFLETRLKLIKEMMIENENYVFIDQYANEDNVDAHILSTGHEILSQFNELDYLFVGAGTTGTLMGCAKLFKRYAPNVKIIAVDAVGSVTFGFPPAKRYIPGLGTSFKPEIADKSYIDDIILVEEVNTIKMCYELLNKHGLFLGGSSATVLQGIKQYEPFIQPGATVVAVAPDFGDRYLQTIYNPQWLEEKFPSLINLKELSYEY